MLGSLRGIVQGRLGQKLLIEVDSVGYWVHTGAWQPTGEVLCYLHQSIREDSNELFGFPTLEALGLFEQLISISGIGPKAGLAVLSLGDITRISQAIGNADAAFLSMAPGIGKKAAEKIILELRGKVSVEETGHAGLTEDLRTALESLGYKTADIQPYLVTIPLEHTTLNDQIRWVLQQMAR